jgi:hypothetical protein
VIEALTGMKLEDIAKRVPHVKHTDGDDEPGVEGSAEEVR